MGEKLHICGGKEFVRFFLGRGFVKRSQKGSHIVLKKKGKRPLVIPDYKELSAGIILNNLKTAGISRGEFNRAMRGK